jgi:hypothetical protein
MPKGYPKNGYRVTRTGVKIAVGENRPVKMDFTQENEPIARKSFETDDQILHRISERFDILESLVEGSISGHTRSLIISGPPGLGKSFTIEKTLGSYDPRRINWTFVKGYVKATGLYKLLYQHREKGKTLVLDDADSVFFDDVSLNMLKAVCDTGHRREVSWRSEATFIDEESAERIPKSFDFEGSIIFVTNIDFDQMIDRRHRLAPHLSALISRSHYINLSMKTKQDYIVRIRQVVGHGMLSDQGLSPNESSDVISFIEKNVDTVRELSLRMAVKIADIRKSKAHNWERIARVTCLKGF